MLKNRGIERSASLGIAFGGALWGVFWLPVRAVSDAGITGVWAGLSCYLTLITGMIVIMVFRRGLVSTPIAPLALCGLLTGSAFTLYATSLLLTDVVRVLLLFYMTPLWSTLASRIFLGERLTINRMFALLLAFMGLITILGVGEQFPWPRNVGDWMALVAGLMWALGSTQAYRLESSGTFEQVLAFLSGSIFSSILIIALAGPEIAGSYETAQWPSAAVFVLLTSLFAIPMMVLTIWPLRILPPARVGLLLMTEVVVGILSAAMLSGEPFGPREAIGSILVLAAGVVEVLGPFGRKGRTKTQGAG